MKSFQFRLRRRILLNSAAASLIALASAPAVAQQSAPALPPLPLAQQNAPAMPAVQSQKTAQTTDVQNITPAAEDGAKISIADRKPPLADIDSSEYGSDMDQQQAAQRRLRLTKQKKDEADVLRDYWSSMAEAAKAKREFENGGDLPPVEHDQAPIAPVAPVASAAPAPAVAQNPVVAAVLGTGGAFKAILLVPGLGEVTAVPGTKLPSGMVVESISASGVVAKSKGKKILLSYGNALPMSGFPAISGDSNAEGAVPAVR